MGKSASFTVLKINNNNFLYSAVANDPPLDLKCNTEKDRHVRVHERTAGINAQYIRKYFGLAGCF